MSLSWSVEQFAIIVLMAATASVVISIVILAARPALYAYAAVAGLAGGTILRLTSGGRAIGEASDGWLGVAGQPLIGLVAAVLLAAILDLLFQSGIPVLRSIRSYGSRTLRPWNWGTGLEIAEQAGVPAWLPGMIGVGVEYRPLSQAELMLRARALAAVLSWSAICVFAAIPIFQQQLLDSLTTTSFVISLCASAFVTFLVTPAEPDDLPGDSESALRASRSQLRPKLIVFLTAAVFFVSIEVMQRMLELQVERFNLYHWILMLQFCALPLLVSTFFFGAALHRSELGEKRWDRAVEASIVAGAIVIAPFPVAYLFGTMVSVDGVVDFFSVNFLNATVVFALLGLAVLAAGVAVAALVSAVIYGPYALAIGLALTDASRTTVRRRVFVAIMIAGAIMQGLTWLVIWWLEINLPLLHACLPIALSFGWALGLALSGFQQGFPEKAAPDQQLPAAA